MPLRKIRRRLRNSDFFRPHMFFYVAIAFACIVAGYLIAIISDSTQDVYQEFKEIESVVSEVEGVKSIDELKKKVRNNPKIMEKINPSMMERFKSNPLFKKEN